MKLELECTLEAVQKEEEVFEGRDLLVWECCQN